MSGLVVFFAILFVFLGISAYFISVYNKIISLRNGVDEAWSNIDTNLQRRADLIPNLISTVKGYAAHESDVLTKLTEARTSAERAHTTGSVSDVNKADTALRDAVVSLNAVAEAYPQLRAVESFTALQEELTTTENKVAFSRQNFNASVQEYNTSLQTFPSNIVAGVFSFEKRDMFIADPESRAVPKVEF